MKKFLESVITHQMLDYAKSKLHELPRDRSNNYTTGDNDVLGGFCVEKFAIDTLGRDAKRSSDILWDIDYLENRIDVKGIKVSGSPQPNYLCPINPKQMNYDVDYYLFGFFKSDLSRVWIAGAISKKHFNQISVKARAGDRSPTTNFTFKHDCNFVTASQLTPIFAQRNIA